MGAVGGVAILGGNFEASTFPEDKVVQRSLTAGTQESSPIDAIILDALPLGAPGQLDSHATVWKGHSNDGSPHTIDWKVFVNVTADDGTGSLWTLQTRIDGAPYTDILTVDDNGLLTVSGATFTMDQLIIDSDNTEAVIVRKDGDAGDVFIIDTINDVVRLGSDTTILTFGGSSDVILERVSARVLQMNSVPGADTDNELRIVARDDVNARWLQLFAAGTNQARVGAQRGGGGGRFDLELFTSSGSIEIWTDGVQRWNFGAGSGGFDFELLPIITNRYDIGTTLFAVRDVFTNRVFLGQDQTSAYDAITIDGTDLAAPGQQDSGAIILTGLSNDGSAHDIDWKQFVNVTANDGTGSIWKLQARIDGASFVDEFTITATTSPTLVAIGPGSTGGALAFGPSASAAQAGTIRFQFTDDVRYRNEGDDGDFIALSFGESSKMILGESGIPFIDVQAQFIVNNEFSSNFDATGAFAIRSTTRTVFEVDTVNNDIELLRNVARPASVVDRFKILGRQQDVNSTVGFSGAILLEGQAREAGGSLHDATWRMYVEPLTTTAFDGQSVFKITAEIDTGGPTTVFTLTDTGDLIVPGSFTIDGLIIDVDSVEAFLVRMNGDGGDVFNVDTVNSLVQLRGGAALQTGATPAATGTIRMSNADSIIFRNAADDGDLAVLAFDDSDTLDIGPQAGGINLLRIWAADIILQGPTTVRVSSDTAFRVRGAGGTTIFTVDTDNGGFVTIDNADVVISTGNLRFGAAPAATGTIRLSNSDSIIARNLSDDGDMNIFDFGDSNEADFGDAQMPIIRILAGRLESNRLRITHTNTAALSVNNDGNTQIFVVDTSTPLVRVIGGAALTIGATPALSGSIRLSNSDSITMRNANNNGDLNILSSPESDLLSFGDSSMPRIDMLASRFESNRIRIVDSNTQAFTVETDGSLNVFRVNTIENEVIVGEAIPLQVATSVDRFIITGNNASGNSVALESHTFLMQGRTQTSGAVPHTADWRMVVQPLSTTAFDGQSAFSIVGAIDGAGLTTALTMRNDGRVAFPQPEQLSIGSPTFIDNVQVNITGSFIDDYGGGPTETHKLKIQGGQTGDAGRTNRQTSVDVDTFIITQNNSEVINEVGAMFIDAPALTVGTDTVNIAYTLKVNNYPTDGTENYGLLVDGNGPTANLTALVRIGKSGLQTGIKLLVGGSVGFDNLAANTQMRLTGIYTSDGSVNSASLLHVHTTLLPEDGTTDHITGAFFEATLRTQVAADENVANISQVRIDEPNIQDNLTGTGEITNAQSLLITGAPTEGESNYALRILGGDLQVASSSAYLFRSQGDSQDFAALAVEDSEALSIGGSGSADFEAVNIYSLGPIRIFPTDDLKVLTDNSRAFQVGQFTGGARLFEVTQTQTRVIGSAFVVQASVPDHEAETRIQSTFADVATSSGSSVFAAGLIPAGSFVIGITVLVTSTVGGPASFDVGDGTDVDRWGASISGAASTTTDITDFTTSSLTTFPFANDVRLTSTGVDFTSGSVRITVHYMTLQTSTDT